VSCAQLWDISNDIREPSGTGPGSEVTVTWGKQRWRRDRWPSPFDTPKWHHV